MSNSGSSKDQPSKLAEIRDTILGLVLLVVIGAFGWNWLTADDDAPTPAQAQISADDSAEAAAKEERLAREKAFGFQCLSGWDGSHVKMVKAVKDRLNDPDSFEHDETRTWTVDAKGRNAVVMSFRAKNAFGGVIRSRAVGSFDNQTCDVTVEAIE